MEAALEGDDPVRVALVQGAIFTCELDRALIGFRAGIGEEHLIEATLVDQRLCQLEAGGIVKGRTWGQQQLCLRRERFGNFGRRMAEAIDCPALNEIEIALAGVIPQKRAFAQTAGGRAVMSISASNGCAASVMSKLPAVE